MTVSLKKITGLVAVIAAVFALTAGVANAGVRFSDGTYASVHFDCKSALRTVDVIPDFGANTTDAYFNYKRYYDKTKSFGSWSGWYTMTNQAYGAPVPYDVSVGWMAFWVTYGKYIGGRWEHHEEYATVNLNGIPGSWCWMA
jgi:hypothetical protein